MQRELTRRKIAWQAELILDLDDTAEADDEETVSLADTLSREVVRSALSPRPAAPVSQPAAAPAPDRTPRPPLPDLGMVRPARSSNRPAAAPDTRVSRRGRTSGSRSRQPPVVTASSAGQPPSSSSQSARASATSCTGSTRPAPRHPPTVPSAIQSAPSTQENSGSISTASKETSDPWASLPAISSGWSPVRVTMNVFECPKPKHPSQEEPRTRGPAWPPSRRPSPGPASAARRCAAHSPARVGARGFWPACPGW